MRLAINTRCNNCDRYLPEGSAVRLNPETLEPECLRGECADPLPGAASSEEHCRKCWLIHPKGECDR